MQKVNKAKKRAEHADPTADEAIKKALRSQKARQSRETGAMFEKMIDDSLEWYRAHGVAFISKVPEPMKPIRPTGRGGQFIACYTKQAQPDYIGTMNNGRAVVFDAKYTAGDKLEYSRVSAEQYSDLEMHYQMGAVVFILAGFGAGDYFRIPWPVFRDMQSIYGRKHIKKADCEPYRVPGGYIIKLLEFIEAEEQ